MDSSWVAYYNSGMVRNQIPGFTNVLIFEQQVWVFISPMKFILLVHIIWSIFFIALYKLILNIICKVWFRTKYLAIRMRSY